MNALNKHKNIDTIFKLTPTKNIFFYYREHKQ